MRFFCAMPPGLDEAGMVVVVVVVVGVDATERAIEDATSVVAVAEEGAAGAAVAESGRAGPESDIFV